MKKKLFVWYIKEVRSHALGQCSTMDFCSFGLLPMFSLWDNVSIPVVKHPIAAASLPFSFVIILAHKKRKQKRTQKKG